MSKIEENLALIKRQIPIGVALVAVSKTASPEQIMEVYRTGHKIFGENRPQELVKKYGLLPKDIEWHMIGHLQTNKVKYIVPFIKLIHSVDSMKLLNEIEKCAARSGKCIECLLQIHIAQEATKFGFSPGEARELFLSGELTGLKQIRIRGLMTMATQTDDQTQIRNEFSTVKQLFDDLKKIVASNDFNLLSMGMTSDFTIAIESGSNMVRIGSAVFN